MLRGLALALLLVTGPAAAQNTFQSQTPGQTVLGTVGMCLNASGQAMACSAAGALATPVSTSGPATVQQCSGLISSAADTLDCDVTGSASAVISVNGTWTGQIQVQGASDLAGSGAPLGGRLVFKSGIGSLGTNWIVGSGGALATEYRVITGGRRLVVSGMPGFSGSVALKVTATQNASLVFVNGPVHTADEEAVRRGFGFVATTGVLNVQAGSYLNFVLSNPAGSGRNLYVTLRKFSQTTGNVLSYQGRTNPSAIAGGTAVVPVNRRNDVTTASVATFTHTTSTQNLSTGTTAASGLIPPTGTDEAITTLRMLAPGTSLGYSIGGSGGGLAAQAGIAVDLSWFEENAQ